MTLSISGSTRSEVVPCLPCCKTVVPGCCVADLEARIPPAERIFVDFYNCRFADDPTLVDPFADFMIAPFSAELRRSDLALSYLLTPDYSLWLTGSFDIDTSIPGLEQAQSYFATRGYTYGRTERLNPIALTTVAKASEDVSTSTRLVPTDNKDSQYYAECSALCSFGTHWWCSFMLFRVPTVSDDAPAHADFPGYTFLRVVRPALNAWVASETNHCAPLLANGTGTNTIPWPGVTIQTGEAEACVATYWHQALANGQVVGQVRAGYNAIFSMDWYLSE